MELTSSFKFIDYLSMQEKFKRNNSLVMKRLRLKRRNQFIYFNKLFEKEHDYCLPIKNKSNETNVIEVNEECFEENRKLSDSDSTSSDSTITISSTNLDNINVNNELSSCSLFAIDVTTELLKGALLENQRNQLNQEQSMICFDNNVISPDNCSLSILNQHRSINSEPSSRLEVDNNLLLSSNKKEKPYISGESTPSKLFLNMDIDNDVIKLFPTLDFSTEHTSNEKSNNIESKKINVNNSKNIVLPENINDTINQKKFLSNDSILIKSSQSVKEENIVNSQCEIDTMQSKLSNNLPQLSTADSTSTLNTHLASEHYLNIFNRYKSKSKKKFVERVENPGPILLRDLLCGSKPKTIISPYTNRHLKPYIFRDPETKPLWLRLLNELKEHFRRKNGLPISVDNETIDYSYVRSKHIPSVNALARQFFWPGIDLTDSLLYPDFSVIALYKNLVIGFGFMVPDISTNENYITFLFTRPNWTNCGIAKFMVYHLIQTCVTRDITLHVSPNNPAMILYQKFGFKVEEFVQNFYENYIPATSEMSKHAFFLRLRSSLEKK